MVLSLLLLLACRREPAPSAAPRSVVDVRQGSVLIIENKTAIARFVEGERIGFDGAWTPSVDAIGFLDAAVLRYLEAHPPERDDDRELELQNARELSSLRQHLGSYVRECAGILSAGRRQIVCQFILRPRAIPPGIASEDRSFTNIDDGGCDVFRVVADVERREVVRFGCNGYG